MKRILTLSLAGILMYVMSSSNLWSQATAQINGSVQDQSGAVLPGVEITATQTDTGVSRMTISNEAGLYTLPNLPLGPYRLQSALPGFRTFVQSGIVLQVNSNPTINVVLQVGQVSEQVEVQANASQVETRSISVGQVMETERILDLPLNGRNAQELLLLGGGAVQEAPAGGDTFPGRLMISNAGGRGPATEFTLDGIRHIDPWDGLPMLLPFPDALAEFKTETSGQAAQQMRASEAAAVTKSGTNAFHGDLFEFVRNDLFNATTYFATVDPKTHQKVHSTLKRNQFGGTIGGPLLKNKLFFFGGYQGTLTRQDSADSLAFIPTAAMMAGDFTAFAAPACNAGRAITLKAPFANNRIDPSLFSPAAVQLVSRMNLHTDNPCGDLFYRQKMSTNESQIVSRFDFQLNAKHALFGRYLRSYYDTPSPYTYTPDNILNTTNGMEAFSNAIILGSTYLISPTTINAFRMSYSGDDLTRIAPTYFEARDLGINIYNNIGKVMSLTINSGFSLAGAPGYFRTHLYQISDDVSMTRGKHQFGFGAYLAQSRPTSFSAGNAAGTFTFAGTATGLGLADFLTGKLTTLDQEIGSRSFDRVNYAGLYAQDTWQVKPRLSVTAGLRWAPILPIMDNRHPVPNVLNWDYNRYLQGIRSQVFTNAPPGFLYPGDPGFMLSNNGANASKPSADLYNPKWKLFSPRLGFAWDVQGDGRTSLRASYGLSYEDYPVAYMKGAITDQAPWGFRTRVINPGPFEDPYRGFPGGDPYPITFAKDMPFIPGGTYMPAVPDLPATYTQSWNLSLQRQVMKDMVATASYLGTSITHLQAAEPLNMPIYIPGNGDANGNCFLNGQPVYFKVAPGAACATVANTDARRTLALQRPQFANEIATMGQITAGGTQNYQAMLLSLQQRPTHGVTANVNYTFSHCVGDYAARLAQAAGPDMTYMVPTDRRRDRASCEYDQRHSFNLTGVAQTPAFANHLVTMLGSGWRLSGIYRRATGGATNANNVGAGARTVTIDNDSAGSSTPGSTDPCRCNIRSQRPDLVLPNAVYLNRSGRPGTQYLNPGAFAIPAVGTFGNLGRVTLDLPPSWQFDVGLSRVFRVHEGHSLEARVEAFNVMNSFRPGDPKSGRVFDTWLTSSNFGKIRTALDPRILQFAMKYVF